MWRVSDLDERDLDSSDHGYVVDDEVWYTSHCADFESTKVSVVH